jgi:hypothetical protein
MRREQMRSGTLFGGSGWYMGFSAGTSNPSGDFRDLGYGNGFNVNVPIGYHKPNQLLGVRLDLSYNQFNGTTATFVGGGGAPVTLSNSDPRVLSAALNATLRFPLNSSRTTAIYALGGGGVHHFQNYGPSSALSGYLGNDVLDENDETEEVSKTKWGFHAGGGLEFGIGMASLFLESRVVDVFADRGDNVEFDNLFGRRGNHIRWIPIVLGVNFR